MTIVKTKGVASAKHARNLRAYIEGKDAVLRDSMNIFEEEWAFEEMAETRRLAGHDRPARKGSKNTIILHFVLAFLPEEADFNGGPMTAEACMAYAREFAARRGYDEHQVVFALHRERCEADGTERWAVHMAVNRTRLSDGKRLHEGRGAQAKRDRAAAVRELDAEWGLRQVVEGVPNSKLHALQPQRQGAEKRIVDRAAKRGIDPVEASYKHNLRELCRIFRDRATGLDEYRDLLEDWGVETEVRNGKVYAVDTDNRKYRFSLERLDSALSMDGLEDSFARNARDRRMASLEAELRDKQRQIEAHNAAKERYLAVVEKRYREYRALARSMEGTRFEDFPKISMPKIPEALAKDGSVRMEMLSRAFKADELRAKLSTGAPKARRSETVGSGYRQDAPRIVREEPQRGGRNGRDAR